MATKEMWTYGGGVRTEADLDGYEVEARDGSIGTVDEDTNEVGRSYVIVDTGPWIFGKRVLLPAGVIERVDRNNRRLFVNRTRDEIKRAPEYDPASGLSPEYRQQLGTHYGTGAMTGVTIEGEALRRSETPSRQSQARSSSSGTRRSSSRTRSSSNRSRSSSSRTRSQAKSSSSRSRSTRGRSTRRQSEGPTKEELYAQAKRLNIEGRSKMNKTQLARAVGRRRGSSTQSRTSQRKQTQSSRSRRTQSGRSRAKTTPVEVQAFLDGVSYPSRKGELLREAERSGARREVRTTLERLPEKRFGSPTEVSEAIGRLRR
jgi:Protein of unknown function (DUF2795)